MGSTDWRKRAGGGGGGKRRSFGPESARRKSRFKMGDGGYCV